MLHHFTSRRDAGMCRQVMNRMRVTELVSMALAKGDAGARTGATSQPPTAAFRSLGGQTKHMFCLVQLFIKSSAVLYFCVRAMVCLSGYINNGYKFTGSVVYIILARKSSIYDLTYKMQGVVLSIYAGCGAIL